MVVDAIRYAYGVPRLVSHCWKIVELLPSLLDAKDIGTAHQKAQIRRKFDAEKTISAANIRLQASVSVRDQPLQPYEHVD